MPSGPTELHERWGDDGTALTFLLSKGYREKGGIIHYPNNTHKPTEKENSAMDYLFLEWDYAVQIQSKEGPL